MRWLEALIPNAIPLSEGNIQAWLVRAVFRTTAVCQATVNGITVYGACDAPCATVRILPRISCGSGCLFVLITKCIGTACLGGVRGVDFVLLHTTQR